jgi:riboflavin kinase/FMN adenylyltransferase
MGSFDGVHAGHRELLRQVTELAREKGVESVVMTFDPHPRFVLGTGEGLQMLSTIEEKAYLLEQMGIDSLVVIPFTKQFSLLSPKEFIEQMVLQMGIGTLVVGYNHRFGHNKEGDYDFLERQHPTIEIHRVEQQLISQSKVSSTIVRQMVARGMMERVGEMLASPYIIKGHVVENGVVVGVTESKMLPPQADYEVRVGEQRAVLTIGEERRLRLKGAEIKGEVIIKFE